MRILQERTFPQVLVYGNSENFCVSYKILQGCLPVLKTSHKTLMDSRVTTRNSLTVDSTLYIEHGSLIVYTIEVSSRLVMVGTCLSRQSPVVGKKNQSWSSTICGTKGSSTCVSGRDGSGLDFCGSKIFYSTHTMYGGEETKSQNVYNRILESIGSLYV